MPVRARSRPFSGQADEVRFLLRSTLARAQPKAGHRHAGESLEVLDQGFGSRDEDETDICMGVGL